jgi:DNA invertase Pin-like site-specific DNA recombinase
MSQNRIVVIYARAGSITNGQEIINTQLEQCRTWAKENGYRVLAEYSEFGSSSDDLPELSKALLHAKSENAYILCVEATRLSRAPKNLAARLTALDAQEIGFLFVDGSGSPLRKSNR